MNKTRFFSAMLVAAAFSISMTRSSMGCRNSYDWSYMKEIRGYGNIDPDKNGGSGYIQGDTVQAKKIFAKVKEARGTMPEGAARYAVVIFRNGMKVKLHMITGRQLAFRVVNNNYPDNRWYENEKPLPKEEADYIRKLQAYREPVVKG